MSLAGTLQAGTLILIRRPGYHALATVITALLLVGFIVLDTLRIV